MLRDKIEQTRSCWPDDERLRQIDPVASARKMADATSRLKSADWGEGWEDLVEVVGYLEYFALSSTYARLVIGTYDQPTMLGPMNEAESVAEVFAGAMGDHAGMHEGDVNTLVKKATDAHDKCVFWVLPTMVVHHLDEQFAHRQGLDEVFDDVESRLQASPLGTMDLPLDVRHA